MKIINLTELNKFITDNNVNQLIPEDPKCSVAGILWQLEKNSDAAIVGEQDVPLFLMCYKKVMSDDKIVGMNVSLEKFVAVVMVEPA